MTSPRARGRTTRSDRLSIALLGMLAVSFLIYGYESFSPVIGWGFMAMGLLSGSAAVRIQRTARRRSVDG